MNFPASEKKDDHELIGYYFVTRENGSKLTEYQGRILSRIDQYGYFIVGIFSWLDGNETFRRVVSMDEIHRHFYLTSKQQDEHEECCAYLFGKPRLSIFCWEEE